MSRFLDDYRLPQRHGPRVERILALSRAFLAIAALIAIYFDPTEPTRFADLVYGLLLGYALYSVLVLVAVRTMRQIRPNFGRALHGVDILWASALTFFSEGPVSPFFLFFLFVSLAAAYRWGFRETMATTILMVLVLFLETGVAAAGPWRLSINMDWTPVIIRTTYLILTGVLVGYLADQEKQLRAEMAAVTDAMRQPRVERGLGGSVSAIARLICRSFGARSVDIVIQDHENGRTVLWHVSQSGQARDPEPVRRLELDDTQRAAWFFAAPQTPWSSAGTIADPRIRAIAFHPDIWHGVGAEVELPTTLIDDREFKALACADFGLKGEWSGRILVFDPVESSSVEARVHLLASLTDHITPALSNIFLLRRLRSRASAAERARVARELHDGAIQALIGIELKTATLRRRIDRETPALEPEIGAIQELLRDEVLALRELMQELRPVELDAPHHLPELLTQVVERFGRETGLSARFVSTADTARLPIRLAIEVVRIVQEGLVNVRKHSRAHHVIVRLAGRPGGGWVLRIEDDGRGFEFSGRLTQVELDARWLGPSIIKERARGIGGEVVIESTPGTGACVEVAFSGGAAR